MTNDTSSTDNSARRTDLRTVEPHYSAREAYAALGCPYPGTRVREEKNRRRARASTQQARRRGSGSGSDATTTDATGDRRGEVVSL